MYFSAIIFLRNFALLFPLLILFGFSSAIQAANDPNAPFTGTSLSGDNTYAQIKADGSNFNYSNGTLTLTGNNVDELFTTTGHSRNLRFSVDSDAGNATLILQKGTFTGNIGLSGNDYNSTLIAGAGATTNLPTITVTGTVNGANNGSSHIITNGANLVITNGVGTGASIGELYAQKGNITINGGNGQYQVIIVRAASGMQIVSQQRFTIRKVDLESNAAISSLAEIHINNAIGSTDSYMQPGSLLSAETNIFFLDPHGTDTGGITNASGTIRAGGSIASYGSSPTYNLLQGTGHLTLEAGGNIEGVNITADNISAGRAIVAGPDGTTVNIDPGVGSKNTPAGTLTASQVIAPQALVAAGEITDFANHSSPSRIEANRLMTVKGATLGSGVSSGNFILHNGSFSFTGTLPAGNSEYDASGRIIAHNEAVWIGGDMNVNNSGSSDFTTLGVGGNAVIAGGSVAGNTLNAGSATLHNGVNASIGNVAITNQENGFFAVGANDDTASTSVQLASLALNGTELRVGAGGGTAAAAIATFTGGASQGNYTNSDIYVGHNGMLTLGSSDSGWLSGIAARAAMPQNAAILGVPTPFMLGGGLYVDSGWSQPAARSRMAARSAGETVFSGNSLLAIDGAARGVNYSGSPVATTALPDSTPGAISSETAATANVAGGAKIFINHVTPGHTYVALGKNITTLYADDTAWKGANLLSSNPLLGLVRLDSGMEGQFGVVEHAPHVTRITATSGVPHLARAASEAMEEAIYHRIRLGQEDLYRRSFALWALPLYQHVNSFDLAAGSYSYGFEGGIGGIAIGCDYTWENTLRLGIAMNIGAGYAKSNGDVSTTQNNMNFWGLGAYAVWKPGAFSLDADLDFTSTYNKLKQDLPSGLPAAEIKADIPATALGMSLRAQYEFDTDWLIIRPHFGVRYFHLDTEPYDVTMKGDDVLRSHRSYQNVWTFPFGIVFTKNFQLGDGYELTPIVNLKAIPASGDIYVKNKVRYAGSHRDLEMNTQTMDSITWGGRAGVEFRAGDFSVGINYNAQFGSHTSNQGVFGVLRYEF